MASQQRSRRAFRRAASGAVLGTVLAFAACGEAPTPHAEIRPVRTTVVEPGPIDDDRKAVGEIRPRQESDIGFQVGGKLISRAVDVGNSVKTGDLLARLDEQDFQNRLRSAQSDVASADAVLIEAQATEARQQDLLAKGVTTVANYDAAVKNRRSAAAQLEATKAALDLAQDQLAYTQLKADFDGIVTAVSAEPGQVVGAGQIVVKLARPDQVDAVFNVAEAAFRDRQAGEKPAVVVSLLSSPSITTDGVVREVSPVADPTTRTYQVKVTLENPPVAMRFGAERARPSQGHDSAGDRAAGERDVRPRRASPRCGCSMPASSTVKLVPVEVSRVRDRPGRDQLGARQGGCGGHSGRQSPARGPEGPARGRCRLMSASPRTASIFPIGRCATRASSSTSCWSRRWRVSTPTSKLGREEDPPFTIKTMVVKTLWPGATTTETLMQVTDRIEKKLEELPHLDYVRSYTKPGEVARCIVNLQDSTPAVAVPDLWYQVRKKISDIRATLPSGISGPFFNDEFGDTYCVIYAFTSDGFSHRELRDQRRARARGAAARARRGQGRSRRHAGRKDLSRVLDAADGLARHRPDHADAEPAGAERHRAERNARSRAERIAVRVSGSFNSEESLKSINFQSGNRFFRLSDIATVRRGYVDPPQPMFRYNGEPAIGLAISMAVGGDVLALGEAIDKRDGGGRRRPAHRHRPAPRRRPAARRGGSRSASSPRP